MNVERGTVAAHFLFWENLLKIFGTGSLQCAGDTFCELFRDEGEEVRAAYLMVKSSTEEELTSVQQFMEALQFAGK
jgi:hypothetical protein